MRILLTSASSPVALYLARLLSSYGHTVYGVDVEKFWGTAPARYSRVYAKFLRVCKSRTCGLGRKEILENLEGVHLVIPCGREGTVFKDVTKKIEKEEGREFKVLWHEGFANKETFQDFVRERVLSVSNVSDSDYKEEDEDSNDNDNWRIVKLPLAFDIFSHLELEAILSHHPNTNFELQLAPYDDDGDTLVDLSSASDTSASTLSPRTLLQIRSDSLEHLPISAIAELPISELRPYRLTEVINVGTVFEAHSLINGGSVQTFIVTTEAEGSLMIVPPTEPVVNILQAFMETFVHKYQVYNGEQGLDDPFSDTAPKAIAGHLTLKFIVQEVVEQGLFVRTITATECSNKVHPSTILLATSTEKQKQLMHAYTAPTENWHLPWLQPEDVPNPRGLFKMRDVGIEIWDTLKDIKARKEVWWRRVAQLMMMVWVWVVCFREEYWCWRDPGPAIVEWVVKRLVERTMGWAQRKNQKFWNIFEEEYMRLGWLFRWLKPKSKILESFGK
jgi:hypothetical protein